MPKESETQSKFIKVRETKYVCQFGGPVSLMERVLEVESSEVGEREVVSEDTKVYDWQEVENIG